MVFIIWIVLSIVCAISGSNRNIGSVGAFFVSLIFSPLVGIIAVALSSISDKEIKRRAELTK